jgi:methanogenic corrinoid protein MtbC1
MGREIPKSSVLGIIPQHIDVFIGLSQTITDRFQEYISTLLKILQKEGISVKPKETQIKLEEIIEEFKNPNSY